LLGVFGAAVLLGKDPDEVLQTMSSLGGVSGRFEVVRPGARFTVSVDYAHPPDALRNVLETIEQFRGDAKQVITVVGCGGNRDKAKRPVMASIACKYSDRVVLTSDNPRDEDPVEIIRDMQQGITPADAKKAVVQPDREEAIKMACMMASDKDIIL